MSKESLTLSRSRVGKRYMTVMRQTKGSYALAFDTLPIFLQGKLRKLVWPDKGRDCVSAMTLVKSECRLNNSTARNLVRTLVDTRPKDWKEVMSR